MPKLRTTAYTAVSKPQTLKSTLPRFTEKKLNDLLTCTPYRVFKNVGKGCTVERNKKFICCADSFHDACRMIKRHAQGTSIAKTIEVQFLHFIDADDYDI